MHPAPSTQGVRALGSLTQFTPLRDRSCRHRSRLVALNFAAPPPPSPPLLYVRQEVFPRDDTGGFISVADYYKTKHGIALLCPRLPCLVLRGRQCWVPMELCSFVSGQVAVRACVCGPHL